MPLPRLLPPVGRHWSDACRAAAREARGDVLFFLHAGLTPVLDCRPEQLVVQAARRDLAMVGGLVWKRGVLWNGGFAPDVTGLPFPLLRGTTPEDLRTHCWGQFLLARHALGVARECMACRRADAEHEPLTPEAEAHFRAQWGATVRRHGQRNANLRAAPDYGWRLILDGTPEQTP